MTFFEAAQADDMATLKLFLLGPARVELDGRSIETERHKELALLIYLAVTAEPQARDTLATLLWPDSPQSRARANLSRDLSILNKALPGNWLEMEQEHVRLRRLSGFWLDVEQFQQLAGYANSPKACLETLTEAASLYRDDFLTGFTLPDCPDFDEWQFFQTEGLRQTFASLLERLVELHTTRKDYEAALAYARRWLALDPLHEPAHRHLMQLYAYTGQRAAALHQYQRCVETLEAELGLPPAGETIALYERIRSGDLSQAVKERSPRLAQPLTFRHNLPAQATPFVGRARELVRLGQMLADPELRLVTIVGAGGMGKTRLALETAARLVSPKGAEQFPHGIYLVRLAALDSPEAILPAIAEALNFTFYKEGDQREQLLDYLRPKTMLLLLDNFECLLAGTDLLLAMLEAAAGLKLLVTSRTRLNVRAEQLFHLSGIDFPEQTIEEPETASGYSAVQLFVQSVRRVQPDFALTRQNVGDVVHLCRMVQGMPLALILIAAWVEILSPAEIALELSAGLDLLETGLRDVPKRQQSIRAVFDHSWGLLTPQEQPVFEQLSLFRGGFTRPAAQAVTGVSLPVLMALVNKSFLEPDLAGRYGVHELLRQYGAEKLEQLPALGRQARDRHSAYYTTFLQCSETRLKGAGQAAALAELKLDWENIQSAWKWAVEQRCYQSLAQAVDSLGLFCEYSGRYLEGATLYRLAVDGLAPLPELQSAPSGDLLRLLSKLLTWQAVFNDLSGEPKVATRLFEQSLAILEESPALKAQDVQAEKAFLWQRVGLMMLNREGPAQAKTVFERSLALYQAVDDRWGLARTLGYVGWMYHFLEDHRQARPLLEQSLALSQALGDEWGMADVQGPLAFEALASGQPAEGQCLMEKALEIAQRLGHQQGIAIGLACLGQAYEYSGKFNEALLFLNKALIRLEDIGYHLEVAMLNQHLSRSELYLGQYEAARQHAQKALTFFQKVSENNALSQALCSLGLVALVSERYEEAQQFLLQSVELLRETGVALWLGEALAGLVYVSRNLGDLPQARQYLHEALQTTLRSQNHRLFVNILPPSALLLADQKAPERAVELYALALRHPFVANSRWFEEVAGRYIAAVAATLPPHVVVAAQARGQARALEATVIELLAEFEG